MYARISLGDHSSNQSIKNVNNFILSLLCMLELFEHFLHVIIVHEKNGPRAILTVFVKRIVPRVILACTNTSENGPRVIVNFLNVQLRMALGPFLIVNTGHNQIQTLNNGLWAILVYTHHSKNGPRAILFSLNVCACKSISKNGPRAILAYIQAHTHIET